MDLIRTNGLIGTDQPRVEGVAKVTGTATYGADHAVEDPAHAALVTSPFGKGWVQAIAEERILALPGVLAVLTHKNVGRRVKPGKPLVDGGYMSHAVAPLLSERIHFAGQIVAVVVAETPEIAQAAAEALPVTFEAEAAAGTLDSPGAEVVKAKSLSETSLKAGDVAKGLAEAAAVVDAWYETPPQHHNPMELFQTTCVWSDDELTIYESTQNVRGFQHGVALQLGLKPAQVRVLSPFVGGAFGSRGELGQQTALIALVARQLDRPVKLVITRQQGFTARTFRAETRHHVRLGAAADGGLTALSHESWELTSRTERFAVAGSASTARLYACPNVETLVHNVEADRQAPGFMRAPPETPYLFAMECAMDELAYKLGMDPLDLRRRNDTLVETVTHRPYTSRSVLRCLDHGAALFGWSQRPARPATLRHGNDLVGYGYATAFYPTQIGPADCRVTLRSTASGVRAVVEVGTHEFGNGIWTIATQTAADLLGLSMAQVEVKLGDSRLPAAPLSAGSNSTATICSVVGKACQKLRDRIVHAAVKAQSSPLHGVDPTFVRLLDERLVSDNRAEPLSEVLRRAGRGRTLVENVTFTPHGAPPVIGPALVRQGKPILVGGANLKDRIQFAQGAHFVEVRVDRSTGQIRVPRVVGVFAGGRIMNPRTARAQLQGGQVWGIASALLEATELDRPTARYTNANLAEYHLPTAADIGSVETVMLEEVDTEVNPLGVKGIGELGVTGMNAALANAVFHATGVRVRHLPLRLDSTLLQAVHAL